MRVFRRIHELIFETESASDTTSIKYPQPNILLVDMSSETETALKAKGYNVSSGSFGVPYKVTRDDSYLPVVVNGNLTKSAVSERDIVIVDLVSSYSLEAGAQGEKHTSQGELDWWAKCSQGIIDPRPRLMAQLREDFDRIVEHGGVLVVFADNRYQQDLYWARNPQHYGFQIESNIPFDNWSFSNFLEPYQLRVTGDPGSKIFVSDSDHSLRQLLSKHATSARFVCTLQGTIGDRWIPLAENKYGGAVAGALIPANRKGLILVLPRIKDEPKFLSSLLEEVLPEIAPTLFPYVEGARWVQRPEYEIPRILELKSQIQEIEDEAKKQVIELEKDIEAQRDEASYQHALISATGRPLVLAVHKALETLGFKSVVDVDETEESKDSGFLNEDLQIHDSSPILLIEVKGIGNLPKDEDALAVSKYEATRMKEWNRTDVKGLSIINHQRYIPALDRENKATFRNVVLESAQKQKIGLLTTWDLHRLLRSYLRNHWSHEQVGNILYRNGRIHPIPEHYEFVGIVERFIEELGVVGVKLTEGEIRQGDRIAFELPVEFLEQNAESLHIENEKVAKASRESLVGIETKLTKGQAKQGTRVYRVI